MDDSVENRDCVKLAADMLQEVSFALVSRLWGDGGLHIHKVR